MAQRTCTWSQVLGRRIWRLLSPGLGLVWKRGAVNSPFNQTLLGLFLGKSTRNVMLDTEHKVFCVKQHIAKCPVSSNTLRGLCVGSRALCRFQEPTNNSCEDSKNEVDPVNGVDVVNEADAGDISIGDLRKIKKGEKRIRQPR